MPTHARGLGGTSPLNAGRRRLPSVISGTTEAHEDPEPATNPPPAPAPAPAEPGATADQPDAAPRRSKMIPRHKTQVTSYLPTDLVNDARDAVVALTPNPAGHRTLSALVEEAVRREITRLSETHNDGRPFPRRQVELQAGRPSGT